MKMKTQTSVTLRGGDKKRAKLRILGLDIIRSLAILFVIAGHFFVFTYPLPSLPTNFEGLSLFLSKQGLSLSVSNGSSIVHHADRIPEYK